VQADGDGIACHDAPVTAGGTLPQDEPPPDRQGRSRPLSSAERAAAAVVGVVAVGSGAVATFLTENELGTLGLLVVGGSFLLIAVTTALPTRLNVGGNSVVLERTYDVIQRAINAGGPQVQEQLQDALEVEASARGIQLGDAAVEGVLQRFVNYSGSDEPREIASAMRQMGWHPILPPKHNYIRWVYDGRQRSVSIYQNSGALVTASAVLRDLAGRLPGAVPRSDRNEVMFGYLGSVEEALNAADAIRRFANGT
jgi:hypothetical protein